MTLAAPSTSALVAQSDNGHQHLWRIMNRSPGTPRNQGLLPTAVGEAQIVSQQAALVAGADTLAQMVEHAALMLHAVDPSEVPTGPGLGYGVRRAMREVAAEARQAASAATATPNVRAHAVHVAASAENVVAHADTLVRLAHALRASPSPSAAEAVALARDVRTASRALFSGVDANRDGRVGWQEGEGGLTQALEHMRLMLAGEGIR